MTLVLKLSVLKVLDDTSLEICLTFRSLLAEIYIHLSAPPACYLLPAIVYRKHKYNKSSEDIELKSKIQKTQI